MDCQHNGNSLNVTTQNDSNTSGSGAWAQNHPTIPLNVCPACGYCPSCGRGGHYTAPYYPPYQPNYPYMPVWPWFPEYLPTYTTYGTATAPSESVKVWC